MAGWSFADSLRAAQQGRSEGLVALFHAHQPALIRTLRGLSPALADRASTATWRQVVRDLASYRGDEYGFRVWLITLGRIHLHALQQRATEHRHREPHVRTRRELRTLRFVGQRTTRGDRAAPPGMATPPGRGVPARSAWPLTTDEALQRVRELPPDQAEAVLLRVVAALDVLTVADRLHRGSGDTRALYQHGLRTATRPRPGSATPPPGMPLPLLGPAASRIEALLDDDACVPAGAAERRLAELVALLRAPATDDDLTGEAEALAAFTSTHGRSGLARARRRTVAVAVVSAATTVMTITTAAAATGTLPNGLQQWAHTYVGAPAPPPERLTPLVPDYDAATAVRSTAVPGAAASSRVAPASREATTHATHGHAVARRSTAEVGEPAPAIDATTSPLAQPLPSTTPAPSAAPSITGSPDATTSPPTTPPPGETGTPSTTPSEPVSSTPTAVTPPSSTSATPSSTPSASAASPTPTASVATSDALSDEESGSATATTGQAST